MKQHETDIDTHLKLFRVPPAQEMMAAEERALARLRAETAAAPKESMEEPRSRAFDWRWRLVLAGASAAVVAALIVQPAVVQNTIARFKAPAVVEAADGLVRASGQAAHAGDKVQVGENLRTNGGAGAMLVLADGSHIEMRSQSELSLERAADGVRIRLHTGGIIVNAAKQPSGHLYVQTKDMTVSVVGTVFLVNAEDDGSRVAVIEGEVSVHEGTTETRLRPREQVTTSPKLEVGPVNDAIAWSRQANAYGTLLESVANQGTSTAGSVQAAETKAQFEESSIRPCDPDTLPKASPGGRGGDAGSFQMTPGRTHVFCMPLATIIRTAYGYGPAALEHAIPRGTSPLRLETIYRPGAENGDRVRGGPDWVRSERYTIEAIADPSANALTMSQTMLQGLLERRFQLKAHIEVEQVPAFSLVVAGGGFKLKPVEADACAPLDRGDGVSRMPSMPRSLADVRGGAKPSCGYGTARNGPNMVFMGGAVGPGDLARDLAIRLGDVRVIDNTGISGRFNFLLEFAMDENTPRSGVVPGYPPGTTEPLDVPQGQTIFTAIEDQLGLKLEPARVPREFIVIDRVERPSPN